MIEMFGEVFGEAAAYVIILAVMIGLGCIGLLFEAVVAYFARRKS